MGTPTVMDAQLVTGTIVRFDESRGYGFVAPDRGGDDVFVHANDLESDTHSVACGTRVEFRVVDSGRGPKAYDVRMLDGAPSAASSRPPASADSDIALDDTCEVLSEQEFTRAVTELILAADDHITAVQTRAIRKALCTFARAHGWVD